MSSQFSYQSISNSSRSRRRTIRSLLSFEVNNLVVGTLHRFVPYVSSDTPVEVARE